MDALRATLPVFRTLGEGLLQLVYPAVCHTCLQAIGSSDSPFCERCRFALETDCFAACWRCASTIGPHENVMDGCSYCRTSSLHFSRAVRLGTYEGLLREVILRLKTQAGETLAWPIGKLLAQRCAARLTVSSLDAAVAVPLHWRRRLSRGYNQSEAIARSAACHLRLPYLPDGLARSRHTEPQVGQSAVKRRTNVIGSFVAPQPAKIRGKRLLLVDDVLTTSSTVDEAAKTLRQAGAAEVQVAVLAQRTV
jgi:ComF family protein